MRVSPCWGASSEDPCSGTSGSGLTGHSRFAVIEIEAGFCGEGGGGDDAAAAGDYEGDAAQHGDHSMFLCLYRSQLCEGSY